MPPKGLKLGELQKNKLKQRGLPKKPLKLKELQKKRQQMRLKE